MHIADPFLRRYDSEGRGKSFQAYTNTTTTRSENNVVKPSEIKTIGQAKDEQLGMSEKTDYFSTQATIAFIKQESFSYPACANPDGCNKKVMDNGDGWLCEKCEKKWDAPIYRYVTVNRSLSRSVDRERTVGLSVIRYILNMNVMDHTGQFWVTGFNEVAEVIMGISANDLQAIRETGDDAKFSSHFQTVMGRTFTFQMMAKQDSYNVS